MSEPEVGERLLAIEVEILGIDRRKSEIECMTSVILDRRSEIEDRFPEIRGTTVAPRERHLAWRRDEHRSPLIYLNVSEVS